MTIENKENSDKPSETVGLTSAVSDPACGPSCDCGKPSANGSSKLKIAVCLMVAVTVGAILLFKATGVTRTTTGIGANEFPNVLAKTEAKAAANSAGQQSEPGTPVSAIGDLNSVAADLDTAFLLIPSKDNGPAMKETGVALAAVEKTLRTQDIKTGTFVLQTTSTDYADVTAQMTAPGIMVLTKGKGVGIVSNGITEENLMQAYVASTSGGGCGTGCGPKGCPTSAAPPKKN